MKSNKKLIKTLRELAEVINNYAESIPKTDFEKGGIEYNTYYFAKSWLKDKRKIPKIGKKINPNELSEEKIRQLENITFNSTPTPDLSLNNIKNATTNIDWNKLNKQAENIFQNIKKLNKPELKIGQWYRYEGILAVYQGEGESTYGVYGDKGWLVKATMNWNKNWIPSTKKEVQEALIKEAERRGFKEGMEITDMDGDKEIVEFELANFCSSGNWFELGNPIVFKEGQWAEIIEQDKTKTYKVDALPTKNIGEFEATMPQKAKSGDTIIIKIH